MIIYPTIELQNGQCVSLNKGRLEDPVLWHIDPIERACGFAAAGAQWMHVTDLDAVGGNDCNVELVEKIVRSAGIPVQLGGGLGTRKRVEEWFDKGVARVVIGTAAARDPNLLHELAKFYPDQIVLSVDVWQGQVMTDGWRAPSAFTPETYVTAFDSAPLAGIIVTDIDEQEAQLGVISGLAVKTRHPVIARGTIRNVDDIARLKYIPNIAGTLIGNALLTRDVDLGEALAMAQPQPEQVAEFQ